VGGRSLRKTSATASIAAANSFSYTFEPPAGGTILQLNDTLYVDGADGTS
jgi:hypothetical protein